MAIKFENRIARILTRAGYHVRRQPVIEGISPDFIVESPSGTTIVVEAKAWSPGPVSTSRAVVQAQHYKMV